MKKIILFTVLHVRNYVSVK